jgi:hypothetical protein
MKTLPKNIVHYKYCLKLYFNNLVQNQIMLRADEHIILAWAHEFARSGNNKSITEAGVEYFWFKAEKCINDLPSLGIATKRGMQKKFEKLVNGGFLVPHPRRKSVGAYYAFTEEAKQLFVGASIANSIDLTKVKDELVALFTKLDKQGQIDYEQLFTLILEDLCGDGTIVHSRYEQVFVAGMNNCSHNNSINNNKINNTLYTLSKEKEKKEIFEKEEQVFTVDQEADDEILNNLSDQEQANHEQLAKEVAALEKNIQAMEARELAQQKEASATTQMLLKKITDFEKRIAALETKALARQKEVAQTNELLLKRLDALEKQDETATTADTPPVAKQSPQTQTQTKETDTQSIFTLTANKIQKQFLAQQNTTASPQTSPTIPSKEDVIQIFTEEGSTVAMAEKYLADNYYLIQEGLISTTTIRRNAQVKKVSPTSVLTDESPTQYSTYQLAKDTYEIFNIVPSKKELASLVQQILNIQQERDLSIQQMQHNLKMYEQFISTEGVTTQYSLENWLTKEGNGYGKDWEKLLARAKKAQRKPSQETEVNYVIPYKKTPPEPAYDPDEIVDAEYFRERVKHLIQPNLETAMPKPFE